MKADKQTKPHGIFSVLRLQLLGRCALLGVFTALFPDGRFVLEENNPLEVRVSSASAKRDKCTSSQLVKAVKCKE